MQLTRKPRVLRCPNVYKRQERAIIPMPVMVAVRIGQCNPHNASDVKIHALQKRASGFILHIRQVTAFAATDLFSARFVVGARLVPVAGARRCVHARRTVTLCEQVRGVGVLNAATLLSIG